MHSLQLKELMSPDVVSVDIGATLDDVLTLMRQLVYSCIIIVEHQKPVGIITERDLVQVLAELLALKQETTLYVKDLMSKPIVCVHQDSTLYEALVITQTRAIRHLPVVDDANDLVGLVTQTDIAQAHFKMVEKHRETIEQEIRDRTRDVVNANQELKAMALEDGLLGIGNRRSMEVDMHFTHANAKRYGRHYSCALIDVDHFKLYNDHYGRQAGDEALKQITESIKASLRSSDRLYRYGGEEFLAVMPETSLFEAVQAIHRVLENLQTLALPYKKSPHKNVTVSAGISCAGEKDSWELVIGEADTYLYEAKELGRNMACWNVDGATPSANDDGAHRSAFQ